jgi:hypothetical protein
MARVNEKLQPLDIAVNKPFKDNLRAESDEEFLGFE